MKRTLLITVLFLAGTAFAQVDVNGYYRSDGTYVAPYHRTAPNNTISDNYSTKGNINPYTGQPGTVVNHQMEYQNQMAQQQAAYQRQIQQQQLMQQQQMQQQLQRQQQILQMQQMQQRQPAVLGVPTVKPPCNIYNPASC